MTRPCDAGTPRRALSSAARSEKNHEEDHVVDHGGGHSFWRRRDRGARAAARGRPTAVKEAQWGPAPPMLPPGAQIAVLSGDPGKAAPYTVRLKFPANYAVPAHSHP